MTPRPRWSNLHPLLNVALILLMMSCSTSDESTPAATQANNDSAGGDGILALPAIRQIELNGRPLAVVATTSIIGDVVANVGGDVIALTILMGPGQEPHSYVPAARDLATAAEADVIFINGWDLEEALVRELRNIVEDAPLVPVSANIEPLVLGRHESDEGENHSGDDADPHTWFSVENVMQWVENIRLVLGELDPANSATYDSNARAYLAKLKELKAYAEEELARIPADMRFLITNHDALGYFAEEFGFEVLGTIIPSLSVVAEPSASDLAELITTMETYDICTIFTENTFNERLASAVAAELSQCQHVQLLPLYTGAIGVEGSEGGSYIEMFRANVDLIVEGLR